MKQLVHIHGGGAFNTYDEYWECLVDKKVDDPREPAPPKWRNRYVEFLGPEWQVIMPDMPCRRNAKYEEWAVWFEKYFQYFEDEITLVGHSLGAIFLAKYLSENTLSTRIKSLHLVAGPFGWTRRFALPLSLEGIAKQSESMYLYHSRDDEQVPFEHVHKFKEALPSAQLVTFEDRGHLVTPEFPELMENIQKRAA